MTDYRRDEAAALDRLCTLFPGVLSEYRRCRRNYFRASYSGSARREAYCWDRLQAARSTVLHVSSANPWAIDEMDQTLLTPGWAERHEWMPVCS